MRVDFLRCILSFVAREYVVIDEEGNIKQSPVRYGTAIAYQVPPSWMATACIHR